MAKIATITLNTAYDLVGRLTCIELGEVNTVETLGLFPAGKGINVAKVLNDLKVAVTVGGFLGQDNQGNFEYLFKQLGLEDRFQRVAGKTRINVKITESSTQVTDLNFLGYQISPSDWQSFVQTSIDYYQNFDIVAVCGSLPRGVSPAQFSNWLAQLVQQGVKVVLDSSCDALKAGVKAKPWLIKPNQRELENWVGYSLNSKEQIITAAQQLKEQGIANVVVSMGAQGAIWLSDQQILQAQPPTCENVVSTVGAGDSMVAGLIYALVQQFERPQALAFATALSALAVSQSNVGIADSSLLNPILKQIKITQLKG